VVYDPGQPQGAMLLDTLPGTPQIREDDHISSSRPGKAIWLAVIPLTVIFVHGYWAFRLLTR
jgi:hypothetical protein